MPGESGWIPTRVVKRTSDGYIAVEASEHADSRDSGMSSARIGVLPCGRRALWAADVRGWSTTSEWVQDNASRGLLREATSEALIIDLVMGREGYRAAPVLAAGKPASPTHTGALI